MIINAFDLFIWSFTFSLQKAEQVHTDLWTTAQSPKGFKKKKKFSSVVCTCHAVAVQPNTPIARGQGQLPRLVHSSLVELIRIYFENV